MLQTCPSFWIHVIFETVVTCELTDRRQSSVTSPTTNVKQWIKGSDNQGQREISYPGQIAISGVQEYTFSHTFVEKIEKSIHFLPVCKLYPTLLALLSHTASSVAYEG